MRISPVSTSKLYETAAFHRRNAAANPPKTDLYRDTQNALASIYEELADRRIESGVE